MAAHVQALRRNSFDVAAARKRCLNYRRRILDISQRVTALHIAPAFSCVEIADTLYNGVMRREVAGGFRDVFLMSKGHGCMVQYVILEEQGALTPQDLDLYCRPGGRLGAHPDYGVPGIMASTGSLGHGMGMALGMAYGEKLKGSDVRVFCVLSDGEFMEGSTWEAALMAGNLSVDNLIGFIDNNDFSGLERMSESHRAFYPIADKMRAFGWETVEVNGHDHRAIFDAIDGRHGDKPLMVVCSTVKGKGVSYMEHVPIWHYRSPNKQEYEQAIRELAEVAS